MVWGGVWEAFQLQYDAADRISTLLQSENRNVKSAFPLFSNSIAFASLYDGSSLTRPL